MVRGKCWVGKVGVFDVDEEEAGGRGGGAGDGSVAGGEESGDGVGIEAVRAGLLEAAHGAN